MGKRHHGKGEANGTSASRGRNGAVRVDAADAAAAPMRLPAPMLSVVVRVLQKLRAQ